MRRGRFAEKDIEIARETVREHRSLVDFPFGKVYSLYFYAVAQLWRVGARKP